MATPFTNTHQALIAEGLRSGWFGFATIAGILALWLAWFFFAEVGIYQAGPARLEAERSIQTLEVMTEGRIVSVALAVAREVRAGEVLVQLEDTAVRLKLAEHRAQLESAAAQLRAVVAEIAAQRSALAQTRKATPMAGAELRLRYEQAQPAAQVAQEELVRWRTLRQQGFVTDLQLLSQEAMAQRRRSEVEELRLAMLRQGLDRSADDAGREASIERLRRDAAELEGLVATTRELVQQAEHELRNYTLRAPVAGPLADVAELRPGMIVRPGERLATIVPAGTLKVTAEFPPAALGRVRRGQAATLRLDGFPAEQYGRMQASVLRVAQEPRVGKVRVELAVLSDSHSIPLQHALPGTVEIEVDRSSPANLAWRTAGALLHRSDVRESR